MILYSKTNNVICVCLFTYLISCLYLIMVRIHCSWHTFQLSGMFFSESRSLVNCYREVSERVKGCIGLAVI